jgi:hypothetical protein
VLSVASSHDLSQVFPSDSSEVVDWSIIMDVETLFFRLVEIRYSEAYQTMLASERVLYQEWNSPEEDEAWADL